MSLTKMYHPLLLHGVSLPVARVYVYLLLFALIGLSTTTDIYQHTDSSHFCCDHIYYHTVLKYYFF